MAGIAACSRSSKLEPANPDRSIARPPFACGGSISPTSGQIRGIVTDKRDGSPLSGATVGVTAPLFEIEVTAITSSNGCYFIPNLPAGRYLMAVYYSGVRVEIGVVEAVNGALSEESVSIDTATAPEIIRIGWSR